MKHKKKLSAMLLSLFLTLSLVLSGITVVPVSAEETTTTTVTYNAITNLSDISADDQYVLVAWRFFGGTDSDSTKGYVIRNTNNGDMRVDTSDGYKTITYGSGTIPDEALWKLSGQDSTFSIQNVENQKYLNTSMETDSDTAVEFDFVKGQVNDCDNFAIANSNSSIRFSGSKNNFSLGGGAPETEVARTNACNITIYKVTSTETDEPSEPEATEHQLFFASDYQGKSAENNLKEISKVMKDAGVTPERAVWCGDYVDGLVYEDGADVAQTDTLPRLNLIKSTMSEQWPDIQYMFLQGNHDYSGYVTDGTFDATGAYEFDDYIIYILNEDDFPWWQGVDSDYSDSVKNKATVQNTADDMEEFFDEKIEEGCEKPVIIAAHIPLSWSTRSTTGTTWWMDNIYSNILFPVINEAAAKLDIIYLFGHNHSDIYDNYIGGSVNYLGVGDIMRVPDGTNGTENYTNEIINFTYINAGYIGNVNANLVPSISTASIITITDTEIKIEKYAASGLYAPATQTITRFNYGKPGLAISSTSKKDDERKEGNTETFEILMENAEAVSYNWSSDDDAIEFVSGTDQSEAEVKYTAGGEANIKCVVEYIDLQGQEQETELSYSVTIKALPDQNAAYTAVTDLSKLSDSGQYILVAWRYYGGTDSDSTKGYVLTNENNGNLRVTTDDTYATIEYADNEGVLPENAVWKITKDANGYYFQNVSTGKYLGNSTLNSDEPVAYEITVGSCNGCENYALSTNGSSLRYSATSGRFSNSGSDGATEVARANACNFTIYQTTSENPDDPDPDDPNPDDPNPDDPDPDDPNPDDPNPDNPDPDDPNPDDPNPDDPDPDDPEPTLPYVDVTKEDWYYDAVCYNYLEKTMTGLNETHFGPNESLARAQFAVILYRMNNEPEVEYSDIFPDVPDGEWFTNAILWASGTKVVTGYSDSGKFGPADKINREQMAVMMYRYANYKNYESDAPEDISGYADSNKVSAFAKEAMEWAVGNKIISGKDNGTILDPQGNATRAECATIIMRFMEKFEK